MAEVEEPEFRAALICNRIGSQINHPFCFGLTHPRRETGGVFLGTYEMVCCRTSIREERM
jgi:hypothetical protein